MITHYRFLPPTISPTEEEIKNAHNQALNTLITEFALEMESKLNKKVEEGYSGWDEIPISLLITALENHMNQAKEDPNQWIDVANFAAMIWNRTGR